MNSDLDAFATRLYVTIDDLLIDHPDWAPERPTVGIAPQLTDAELVTLAVIQALLGYTSEARFIRYARTHLRALIRPSLKSEPARPGQRFLRPFRQIIESINQTLKAQLDLERHGGRKPAGVCARILQRLLALTAAIWNNETSNRTGPTRSLIAYDH